MSNNFTVLKERIADIHFSHLAFSLSVKKCHHQSKRARWGLVVMYHWGMKSRAVPQGETDDIEDK